MTLKKRFQFWSNLTFVAILVLTLAASGWCSYSTSNAAGCGVVSIAGGGLLGLVFLVMIVGGSIVSFLEKKNSKTD